MTNVDAGPGPFEPFADVEKCPDCLAAVNLCTCGDAGETSKAAGPSWCRAEDLVIRIREFAALPRIATGFPVLDDVLDGGFICGQTYVLAAGTGLGKTSLVAQMASHRARTAPVVVWSLELPPELFVARVASQGYAEASWSEILGGALSSDEILHLLPPNLYMHMGALDTLGETIKAVTEEHAEAPLVVVDYLQQLASGQPDPRTAVAAASETIRKLAIEYRCPFLVVSAVSRSNASKARTAKTAAEVVDVGRESGSIEYDCAGLLVLSEPDDGDARTLAVAKNRFGRRARISYRFDGAAGTFEELGELEPKQNADHKRRGQIVESLLKAGGGPLSRNQIREREGKRWVSGRKDVVNAEIDVMVVEGLLVQEPGGAVGVPRV